MLSIGHQFLYEQGILHRVISAGDVLLATEPQPQDGHEEFVMDIEFARHAGPTLPTKSETVTVVDPIPGPGGIVTPRVTRTHIKFDTVSIKRGAVVTVLSVLF